MSEKKDRKGKSQEGEREVNVLGATALRGRIFVVIFFHGLVGGGCLVGFGFDAVFFEKCGDLLVFVLELQGREIANHRRPDLVCELGCRVDELLLGLQLLLLALNGQLVGLDFILLALEAPLEALVAPIGHKEPKAEEDG